MEQGTSDVYMARQPIFDSKLDLEAYELLYRSGNATSAGEIGSRESAQALINSLIDLGLGRLCGSAQAFINVDEHLLGFDLLHLLPKERVVLELLETVQPTPKSLEAVKGLAEAGYTIALDDYLANEATRPFLPYAKILKLDIRAMSDNLPVYISKAKQSGLPLLAEKVETKAEFDLCARLGVKFFQGYYFSKPELVAGTSIPPNRLTALNVVARLQRPGATIDEVEELIVGDLALSYRLLRLVKSAAVGLPERAANIRSAVMFLGIPMVASLASILAMSACSTKPPELLATAYTRAKMCELLAPPSRRQQRDRFFTVGLFSVLDAMLDMPMDKVLEQLPLDEELANALLDVNAENDLATALHSVLAYESANWHSIQVAEKRIEETYYDAVDWASTTVAATSASAEPMAA